MEDAIRNYLGVGSQTNWTTRDISLSMDDFEVPLSSPPGILKDGDIVHLFINRFVGEEGIVC